MTAEPIADSVIDPAPAGPRGPSLGVRFAIAFLLGIVLVAGAGGGALYAYGRQYTLVGTSGKSNGAGSQ